MRKYRVKKHAVTQPLEESYRFIPLSQGQVAIVDASDFEWLNQWNWHAFWSRIAKRFYALRKPWKAKQIYMHRLILGFPEGEVDHANMNGLDNRRDNLRLATKAMNMRNRPALRTSKSGFKGVHWEPRRNCWISQASFNGEKVYLGGFATAEDAARAYDAFAIEHHGEFARLNFST